MWEWLGHWVGGAEDEAVEAVGTPLPEGTELVECSFCHSAVPAVAFYEHGRYHETVWHVEGKVR